VVVVLDQLVPQVPQRALQTLTIDRRKEVDPAEDLEANLAINQAVNELTAIDVTTNVDDQILPHR